MSGEPTAPRRSLRQRAAEPSPDQRAVRAHLQFRIDPPQKLPVAVGDHIFVETLDEGFDGEEEGWGIGVRVPLHDELVRNLLQHDVTDC